MLTPEELLSIKDYLYKNQPNYMAASDHVRRTCLRFKVQRPQVLRAIFPREPPVKTFESIVAKLETCREKYKNPEYGVADLNDIVALTVICPYETDVADFIKWMKTAFDVLTPDKDAERNSEAGHRAFHYVVKVARTATTFDFADVRCELQVKTILQEAFDAKAHDLAYKPKKLKVSDQMNHQFRLLSTLFEAIDGQSEFLKDLILRDKREMALRREACVLLYFEQEEVKKVAGTLGLNVQSLPNVSTLANILDQGVKTHGISRELCKLAALCAVKCDADYLRFEARRHADMFVEGGAGEAGIFSADR
jgi:putative GTP pyrophosphokinase